MRKLTVERLLNAITKEYGEGTLNHVILYNDESCGIEDFWDNEKVEFNSIAEIQMWVERVEKKK